MEQTNNPKKMFLEIVKQLRQIITDENVTVGGKLPSERELAERLQVGRSTVREALRSLELLGLIETRRGEGTFLSDYRKHRLVELLSTFILQESKSKEDVHITRAALERDAIYTICMSKRLYTLHIWDAFKEKLIVEDMLREDIIREIIIISNNRLGLKIWFLLKQFAGEPYKENMKLEEKSLWIQLLIAMQNGEEQQALSLYNEWLLLINRGDV
ncbi:transcriptional regulator, GntR family [Paenisporosarcina quisquiliarum]|jgi:DNA-binding transcriptional regulator YhcF (GntR family)|uniref:GntR family transcriptional regulator n=1 Tax=Psychrobacillus psychrodurans TaxID=126157 RepID=A0A9X3R9M7_9BACI|nr:GntR family transcriptional regulator [Psychrobacillus psychrodurans]SEM55837.1 transcriptional regulator, GntR family [Paenisporosarcina quisquiliarum]MCK1996678.1 GntR family transcriptional regulator [Psychrobacillus psychrodurans]MCZ8533161.1 GntR family transcriptional regulator [Psychrobacillus psychrodurans]MCZ8541781.1 GntR family transcriptional regulator [Psychrobacillus psychrodurans]SFN01322.1 regulatory protein, gntR family [Psychrobacillus psychrodurans]